MKILLVEDVGEVAKYGCFERSPKREKPAAAKFGQTDEHFAGKKLAEFAEKKIMRERVARDSKELRDHRSRRNVFWHAE